MDLAERIHWIVSYAIKITIVLAIIGAILSQQWLTLFISCVVLASTFLPAIIERNYKIDLPIEFELAIVLFIYSTLFLGEVHGYYTKFWWWDTVLHGSSSMALGFIGFIIIYSLYRWNKIKAKPYLIAIFSFSFAVAIGTVWEIFEFGMDSLFGMTMQKSGLVDTMWDLIIDSGGALITSTLGYLYIKGNKFRLFERLLRRFIEKNPHLFKRSRRKYK
ncbi:MAG: hypothetical protein L6408_07850 [Nanoarchaeota archaeon]|nr:hypothetical protein [Nanoarchaeota archaeon]